IQPDGEYIYRITADDGQGNFREKQGSVTIDNHFMTITDPVPGTTLNGQVTVKALTSDCVFQESNVLFYARQNGEVEWNDINDQNPPVKQPDGSWTQIINTSRGLNADVEIRVGADYYSYDNELRREYSLPIEYSIINDLQIIDSDISNNPFSPNADGQYDTTAIEYRVNAPAIVTIKIFDSTHSLARTLQENLAMPMGNNSVIWDGLDNASNLVPDGTYTYEITAEEAQQSISETVLIDNHFMQITSPAVGSNLTEDVTLIAMPSANIQNPQNVVFSYRVQGAQTWTNITPAAQQQVNVFWTTAWNVDSLSIGNYEIRVCADYDDLKGEHRLEYSIPNSYIIPDYVKITNVSNSPNAFSPNADGQFDANTLTYDISRVGTVKISVYDQNNTLIRTLKNNISEIAGTQTAAWDGRNNQGAVVSDGTYSYLIEVTDQDNYQAQAQASVAVDNTIITFNPTAGSIVSGQTTIKIIPSPYVTIQGVMFYYKTPGEVYWNHYVGNGVNQGDGTWNVTWDTSNLENGNYEIRARLYYYDADNNFREQYISPVTYSLLNGINIYNVSDSPDSFSPNEDTVRDISTISYRVINNEGFVSIKIYDPLNSLVRTIKDAVLESVGDQTAVWDGKNDQGEILADGIYTYIIEAIDSSSNTVSKQGTITLDNHSLTVLPYDDSPVTGVLHVSAKPSEYCQNIKFVYFMVFHQTLMDYRKVIGNGDQQPDGSWTTDWDTSEFIDGIYKFSSSIYYYDQDHKSREDIVYRYFKVANGNLLVELTDSPDPISPNGDSRYEQTQIKYTLGIESDVSIYLIDENNNNVRTLQPPNTHLESRSYPYSIFWDGKDDNGRVVFDGIYTYKINAVHQPGHEETEEGTISVDTQFATIVDPLPEDSLKGTVTFKIQPSPYVSSVSSILIYAGYTRLGYAVQLPDQTWNMVWDTLNINDGNYKIRMYIEYIDCEGKNRSEWTPEIEYSIANNMQVSRNAFSPNSDGKYDTTTIYYNIVSNGLATVKLFDQNSNLVRILKDNESVGTGLNNVIWDGMDNLDGLVDDGLYTYTIDCEFNSGGNEHQEGTVSVDNHFMRIISPASGENLNQTVSFILEKSDYITAVSGVTMYYRRLGASEWIRFKLQIYNQTLRQWLPALDTTEISNGDYEVCIFAQYKDMNGLVRTEYSMTYSYNVSNPFSITKVFDSPDAFSPNGNDQYEFTTISYFINSDVAVSVSVYDSDNNLVQILEENISKSAGSNSVIWEGKDNAGNVVADGNYIYKIIAEDDQASVVEVQDGVSVDNHFITLVEPVPGEALSGEVVFKIEPSNFTSGMSSVQVEIISPHKIFVCEKQIDGSFQVSVDTKTIANGEYNFQITASYYDNESNKRGEQSIPFEYTIYNEGPDIFDLKAMPNPFSPDESGTWINPDTGEVFNDPAPGLILDDITKISFKSSSHGVFNVNIFDQSNVLIKQLVANQVLYPDSVSQEIELTWDGITSSGAVPNGRYNLVIQSGEKIKNLEILVDKVPFFSVADAYPNPFHPEANLYIETSIPIRISEKAYVSVEILKDSQTIKNLVVANWISGEMIYKWNGSDNMGNVVSTGAYVARITAETEFGTKSEQVEIDIFVSRLTNVNISQQTINPYLDETVDISYYLTQLNVLNVKILNDQDQVVRNLLNSHPSQIGLNTVTWDGKDDNGSILPDDVYYFIIEENVDDTLNMIYDPSNTDGHNISRSMALSASRFNASGNEFCLLSYDTPEAVYHTIRVRDNYTSGAIVRVIKYEEPIPAGSHQSYWDCRDEAGDLVPYSNYCFALWGYRVNTNSIIIVGGKPKLTNMSVSPVNFHPYDNPYEDTGNGSGVEINFNLSRDANINIFIYNYSGARVNTLVSDAPCLLGNNTVVWDGKDDAGNMLKQGDYRIIIQADYNNNYSDVQTLNVRLLF
ncbi:MAG: gliding motility-associated C-terminal domain-containing protein, partial [Candidatus Omnitrophica bacterium]|nr:gliding motility-associated C-terminal domain-containing protein [Candidatus Omnitrophota bacterium]